MGSAGSLAPLDFGAELWKWDEALYESADGIIQAYTRSGLRPPELGLSRVVNVDHVVVSW
jgi:hypothetical protein